MIGRKLRTLPTPLNTPSITREYKTSFTFAAERAAAERPVIQEITLSKSEESQAPTTLKVSQNTSAMMPKKAGIAVYFPVRI